jgi:hypothetical protein
MLWFASEQKAKPRDSMQNPCPIVKGKSPLSYWSFNDFQISENSELAQHFTCLMVSPQISAFGEAPNGRALPGLPDTTQQITGSGRDLGHLPIHRSPVSPWGKALAPTLPKVILIKTQKLFGGN